MNRQKVKSSNIVSIGYSSAKKELEVEFIGSGVYCYSDVEKEIYDNFLKSESKGKFVHSQIRGRYRYEKI